MVHKNISNPKFKNAICPKLLSSIILNFLARRIGDRVSILFRNSTLYVRGVATVVSIHPNENNKLHRKHVVKRIKTACQKPRETPFIKAKGASIKTTLSEGTI